VAQGCSTSFFCKVQKNGTHPSRFRVVHSDPAQTPKFHAAMLVRKDQWSSIGGRRTSVPWQCQAAVKWVLVCTRARLQNDPLSWFLYEFRFCALLVQILVLFHSAYSLFSIVGSVYCWLGAYAAAGVVTCWGTKWQKQLLVVCKFCTVAKLVWVFLPAYRNCSSKGTWHQSVLRDGTVTTPGPNIICPYSSPPGVSESTGIASRNQRMSQLARTVSVQFLRASSNNNSGWPSVG